MNYLGTKISDDMQKDLDKICEISKRSKSSIVKEALATYLEDQADYYAALQALEQHKKSGYKTVSWEDIQKENELLNDE